MKKTLQQLLNRADAAIAGKEDFVYDVAAESWQIVGNVGHMRWFRLAVAEELAERHVCWEHLRGELRAYQEKK